MVSMTATPGPALPGTESMGRIIPRTQLQMNHRRGSSCADEILELTRERKYELQYTNLDCGHSSAFLIKAILELNRGSGGRGRGGQWEREHTEALYPSPQTPKPYHLKIVKRIMLLSADFHQKADFSALHRAGGSWAIFISLTRLRCQNHKISQARAHEAVARFPPMAAVSFLNLVIHPPILPPIHP